VHFLTAGISVIVMLFYQRMWFFCILAVTWAQHDHAGEWELETYAELAGEYVWMFEKVGGDYADPGMRVAVLPIDTCDASGITAEVEDEAAELFHTCDEDEEEEESQDTEDPHAHGECEHVEPGNEIEVGEHPLKIEFDPNNWYTTFTLNYTGCVAMFLAHMPEEFNAVLADSSGNVIALEDSHSEEESSDKRWGESIGANFICMIPTLFALAFVGPVKGFLEANMVYMLSFAEGVLLATAFCHMYPEGFLHLSWPDVDADDAEVYQFWTSGVTIIGVLGLMLGLKSVLEGHDHSNSQSAEENGEKPVQSGGLEIEMQASDAKSTRWNSLTLSVLLGDAMHNFVDGLVIGVAFSDCSSTFGWNITIAILCHEAAHEWADIVILLNQGFSVLEVCLFNFLSGSAAVLGTIIILATDVSAQVESLLLIASAGFFIGIALIDLLPEIMTKLRTQGKSYGLAVFCAMIGIVGMTCLLAMHEHCEEGGDAHAGHNH